MKNNQVTFMLVGVVFLMTVFTVTLVTKYIKAYNQSQELQARIARINYTQQFLQALVYETGEYSKKNPDMKPIVQFATNAPAKPAAAAPAVRPAGK